MKIFACAAHPWCGKSSRLHARRNLPRSPAAVLERGLSMKWKANAALKYTFFQRLAENAVNRQSREADENHSVRARAEG